MAATGSADSAAADDAHPAGAVAGDTHWSLLSRLLDEALDLPAAQRAHWLSTLKGPALGLRPRLEALLRRRDEAERIGFLAEPAAVTFNDAADPSNDAWHTAGEAVGPWRLVALLGLGGMAEVWLAQRADGLFEHGALKREVALKLPLPGLMRGRLAERFARERDILAGLEHRYIARLYDAGVAADGTPWLAMERVQGLPITSHCSEHRLDLPARLRLVQQACEALQHAHMRLVVHRDIKPGNMLVTPEGELRLLDFGIAHLLGADPYAAGSDLTRLNGAALTPDHAAPEQLRAEPATTATDVYSLGVVLYRLLCGELPYEPIGRSAAALEQAVLHAEPRPPSERTADTRLKRQLRGDLDAIVLKALQKLPQQRYPTPDALRADLARHLAGLPVQAVPPARGYRLSRYLRRHRWALAAGSVTAAALLAGSGAAWLQAREARTEAARSAALYRFVLDLFNPGGQATVDGLIRDRKVGDVVADAAARAGRTLAEVPQAREQLLLNLTELTRGLGMPAQAAQLLQQRLELARRLHGEDSDALLKIEAERVVPLLSAGQGQAGYAVAETALAACERQRQGWRALWPALRRAFGGQPACSDATLAALLAAAGEAGMSAHDAPWQQERRQLERALKVYESLPDQLAFLAHGLDSLVTVTVNQGDLAQAAGYAERGLQIARAAYGENGTVTARWKEEAGEAQRQLGHPAQAARLQREALAAMEMQWGRDSADASRSRLLLIDTLRPSRFRDEALEQALLAAEGLRSAKNDDETMLRDWAREALLTLDVRRGRVLPAMLACRQWWPALPGSRSQLQAMRSCTEMATAAGAAEAGRWTQQFSAIVKTAYGDIPAARWYRLLAEAELAQTEQRHGAAGALLQQAWPLRTPNRPDLIARWLHDAAANAVALAAAHSGTEADAVALQRRAETMVQVQQALAALPTGDDAPFFDEARALLLEARANLYTADAAPGSAALAAADLRSAISLRQALDDTHQSLWLRRCLLALAQVLPAQGSAESRQVRERLARLDEALRS